MDVNSLFNQDSIVGCVKKGHEKEIITVDKIYKYINGILPVLWQLLIWQEPSVLFAWQRNGRRWNKENAKPEKNNKLIAFIILQLRWARGSLKGVYRPQKASHLGVILSTPWQNHTTARYNHMTMHRE